MTLLSLRMGYKVTSCQEVYHWKQGKENKGRPRLELETRQALPQLVPELGTWKEQLEVCLVTFAIVSLFYHTLSTFSHRLASFIYLFIHLLDSGLM